MNFRLMFCMFLALVTVACSSNRCCQVPPVNRQQACLDLRKQLIFLSNYSDPTLYPYEFSPGNWNPPTRQAFLLKKYRDYNCDAALRECSPPAINRRLVPCR